MFRFSNQYGESLPKIEQSRQISIRHQTESGFRSNFRIGRPIKSHEFAGATWKINLTRRSGNADAKQQTVDPKSATLLVPQTQTTIGDRLTNAGVGWAAVHHGAMEAAGAARDHPTERCLGGKRVAGDG